MNPGITVALLAEPTTLDVAHLDDFIVGVTVHNAGQKVIDPQINYSELKVNGAPSNDWSMALMNSGHEAKWAALPPGESVTGKWALARALFPGPGDYKLDLTVAGVSAATVEVHVTP
jgi:hypothetical protein